MIKNTKKENTTTLLGINILPLDKRPIRLLPQNLTNLGLVQPLAILVEDSAPHTQTSPHVPLFLSSHGGVIDALSTTKGPFDR